MAGSVLHPALTCRAYRTAGNVIYPQEWSGGVLLPARDFARDLALMNAIVLALWLAPWFVGLHALTVLADEPERTVKC